MEREIGIPSNVIDLFIPDKSDPVIKLETGPTKLSKIFRQLLSHKVTNPRFRKGSRVLLLNVFL